MGLGDQASADAQVTMRRNRVSMEENSGAHPVRATSSIDLIYGVAA
jgi:hypothetical protein